MLPDPILPTPEDDIARILRDYERRLSHLERLEPLDIGARVFNSANIVTATGAWTILTFDSERWDTDGIHSTVLNTSRLTAVTAGKYSIVTNVDWQASALGRRGLRFVLNSVTIIALHFVRTETISGSIQLHLDTQYDLAVGDFVESHAFQDTGGNLNVLASANFSPEFMMEKIG